MRTGCQQGYNRRMNKVCELGRKWSPYILSIMRIVIAVLFTCHGTQKIFGYPSTHFERPALTSWFGIGGIIETIGGTLVLFGLFTRCASFVLSGEMAVAYFKYHATRGPWWPIHNMGEPAVVYCFVFLYLWAAGGGPWSLDSLLFGKRDGPPST